GALPRAHQHLYSEQVRAGAGWPLCDRVGLAEIADTAEADHTCAGSAAACGEAAGTGASTVSRTASAPAGSSRNTYAPGAGQLRSGDPAEAAGSCQSTRPSQQSGPRRAASTIAAPRRGCQGARSTVRKPCVCASASGPNVADRVG